MWYIKALFVIAPLGVPFINKPRQPETLSLMLLPQLPCASRSDAPDPGKMAARPKQSPACPCSPQSSP